MNVTQSRSRIIQIVRGICIIAVVMIHTLPSGLPQVFVRPFLNFCVGVFLFLSGYLSNVLKWNWKKRITKVLIPYFIWTVVYTVMNNIKSSADIPLEFVKGLLLANSAAIMYYIFVYVQFTLLIPIIDKIARKEKIRYVLFVIAPLEIICCRMLPILFNIELNKYFLAIRSISCLGWFSYFYLGYLLGNNHIKLKLNYSWLVIMIAISLVLQIAEGYWQYSMEIANCGTQLKLSAILTGCLLCILIHKLLEDDKEIKFTRWLVLLGNYSFGIYFSHLAIMKVLNFIPYYDEYIMFPITSIIAIGLSLLMCIIGKKILRKYSFLLGL